MIFEFGLLGIMVILVLIFIYYSKKIGDSYINQTFRRIMILNYLIELLYLVVYITIYDNSNLNIILSKIYLSSLITYSSLLTCYTILLVLKVKYRLKDTIYVSKVILLKKVTLLMNILSFVIVCMLPVRFVDNLVVGVSVNVTYLLIFVYSLVSFTVLFTQYNRIEKNSFRDLFIVHISNIILVIIQYYFNDIAIIHSGYVLITLYMYLTLENFYLKELEQLRLEKDSVIKSSLDTNKFLMNMSYEIRTPLNAIDGLSQVIMDSDNIENVKEDVKDIRVASKNLMDTINGIIDISMIETGKMEIVNENYDVYTMLDNVCDIAKSRMKDSKVEFKVDIAKNIPNILMGDAQRMEQILLNLLTNAIKYTESGYILLKVDVINSVSLCRLKMTVSDTGIGIKEEEMSQLFQQENSTKKEDGNRLGLIITKKIVDLMNGKIDVESTYKKGTTFVVTIDQKVVNILKEDKEKMNERRKLDIFTASSKRVLIVDDNKLNLKVATKLLSPYKVEITQAMSGEECLNILEKDNDFDLILMDDLMPNMNGSEVLDVLLKLERVEGYYIPVVVLTANAISGMKEKYLELGFEDYLAKPIDKYELNRVLKKFLKDREK